VGYVQVALDLSHASPLLQMSVGRAIARFFPGVDRDRAEADSYMRAVLALACEVRTIGFLPQTQLVGAPDDEVEVEVDEDWRRASRGSSTHFASSCRRRTMSA
jgi:hypothetical protein